MSIAVEPYKRMPRRIRRTRAESLIATLAVAILGIMVLLSAGMLAPILWDVATGSMEPHAPFCDPIKNPLERLACLDSLRDGLSYPAMGTAPRGTGN